MCVCVCVCEREREIGVCAGVFFRERVYKCACKGCAWGRCMGKWVSASGVAVLSRYRWRKPQSWAVFSVGGRVRAPGSYAG